MTTVNALVDPLLTVDGASNGKPSSSESDSQSDGDLSAEKQGGRWLFWEEMWRAHSKNDYTWCGLIMLFYLATMFAAVAFVNMAGEAVAGQLLLAVAIGIAATIIFRTTFRRQPERVNTGADQLSSEWRLVYNVLCIALAICLFYTMGLAYITASFLWHVGWLTEENSLTWTLLFPTGSSSSQIPVQNISQLLQIGIGTMGDAFPFIVICLILEPIICCKIIPDTRSENYSLGDSFLSVMTQVLPFYVSLLAFEYIQPAYTYIFDNWRLSDTFASEESVVGFWLCVIMADLWYYVVHRSAHIMSWIWTSHMVHHSCEKFNLFNGPRGGVLLVDYTPWTFIDTMPLALFFPLQSTLCVAGLKWTWQFWIHATLPGPWPCLEWILFSPSLHRVHHLKHEDRLGKNYGCILSIWDIMFGTFEPEFVNETDQREDMCYGVIPPVNTWDAFWLQLQPWYDMFVRQPTFNGPFAMFLHWTPPNGKCPKLGSRLNPREDYQEYPTSKIWTYDVLQEVVVMLLFGLLGGGGSSTKDSGRRLLSDDAPLGAVSKVPTWLMLTATASTGSDAHHEQAVVWTWLCGLLGLWGCSCLGWMLKGESQKIWNIEVLRKAVIVAFFAGYMTYFSVGTQTRWTYLALYAVAQVVLLSAIWRQIPKAEELDKASNSI